MAVLDRPGALAAIGGTPIVRISRLIEPGMAEVWVKLEGHNPTGSYKDRMALAMIEGAALTVARRLGPGARVATIQVDSGMKYLGGSLYG